MLDRVAMILVESFDMNMKRGICFRSEFDVMFNQNVITITVKVCGYGRALRTEYKIVHHHHSDSVS